MTARTGADLVDAVVDELLGTHGVLRGYGPDMCRRGREVMRQSLLASDVPWDEIAASNVPTAALRDEVVRIWRESLS